MLRPLAAAMTALATALLLAAGAVPERSRDAPPPVHAPAADITGRWRGRASGLSLTLVLVQTGDTVRGEGTFAAVRGRVGCGGETLPDRGRVSLSGEITNVQLRAHLRFAGGWGPPFIGSLVHPDTLRGHLMAMDRPGCPLTLVRVR